MIPFRKIYVYKCTTCGNKIELGKEYKPEGSSCRFCKKCWHRMKEHQK